MQLLLISIVRNLTILSLVMCFMVMIYVNTIVTFMEALSFAVVLMVPSTPILVALHPQSHSCDYLRCLSLKVVAQAELLEIL